MLCPPPTSELDPIVTDWPAQQLFRVHDLIYAANLFNPGFGQGRFHPIFDGDEQPIPTLYASNCVDGALAESVLHDLYRGDKLYFAQLINQQLSKIATAKPLRLIDLTGYGLGRLNTDRSKLLDTGKSEYRNTARWAEALHEAAPVAQGLLWVSRQFDRSLSLLIFGDRLDHNLVRDLDKSEPLDSGAGLQQVRDAASQLGVCLVEG